MTSASGARATSKIPRLSVMMFMQYAVWGAWLPLAARYLDAGLGFNEGQIGWLLGLAGAAGAVSAPFIAGQLADRYFSTERFLAFLLVVGGAIKWITAAQTTYGAWLWLSIAYSVVYMPTLALSNSLAFSHLERPDRSFGYVRLWGTIGWIVASWVFPMVWLQTGLELQAMPPFLVGTQVPDATLRLADALRFSGLISFAYAAWALAFAPHTPPRRDGVEPLAFRKAFGLLRKRSLLVLVAASLPISVIHQIYFIQTPKFLPSLGLRDSDIGPAMTIGQFSEILVVGSLGFLLRRLGFRAVITLGAFAYAVRYGVWSMTDLPTWVIVSSQTLHGLCYACFFAAGFIYADRLAPADVRHSMQTIYGILILGIGPILGGMLSGYLGRTFTEGGVLEFGPLWLSLAVIGLLTALCFATLFREEEILDPLPEPVPVPSLE
jgi:nucleoside transporter